jgi:hypothetical protein
MSEIQRQPENRTCAWCGAYVFMRRPAGGWAYCRESWKYFEADGEPAIGERTCEKFYSRGGAGNE